MSNTLTNNRARTNVAKVFSDTLATRVPVFICNEKLRGVVTQAGGELCKTTEIKIFFSLFSFSSPLILLQHAEQIAMSRRR